MLTRYVFALVLLSPLLFSQEPPKTVRTVRATGTAIVSAKPDRAEISVGVVNQATTAQAASAENATRSTETLRALRRDLGSKGELSTVGYSISPQYDYKNGAAPRLVGYQASNTVLVTLNDLSLVGKAVDAAIGAGANNVNNISFTLRNDEAVRAQVIAEAAAKARDSAEAIAKALGLHVTGVWQAETREAVNIRPLETFARGEAMMAKATPTPIEAGNLDVTATVIVTLEVQ